MKQVILVRSDLKLPKGKLAAQCAHASVEAVLKSDKKVIEAWRHDGAKKVVLKVKDDKELHLFQRQAQHAGIVSVLITDAGHTVLPAGTTTTLGIGPADDSELDKIIGNLKLV